MRAGALVGLVLGGLIAVAGEAQQIGGPLAEGVVQSPVLVIEFERAFNLSAFGRRVNSEIEAEGARIAAESRRIEAELVAEEQQLTEDRDTMEPAAFRALAQAFDEKVQRLRLEQDGKARALAGRSEAARRQFIAAAEPVLQVLMREANAAVILERRFVFATASAIDVTEQTVQRLDAEIGDGSDLPPAEADAPEAGPGAAPLRAGPGSGGD